MKSKNKKIWVLALGFVFLAVIILTKGFGFFNGDEISQTFDGGDVVTIPVTEISENAKWYEYDSGREKVKFFAVKDGDGSIKTAFDACDVCYYSGKGYRQEGDYMVCNNCGNRYPISGLGTENKTPGGCWPGYLPYTMREDKVFIKVKDLTENSWRTL